MSHLKKSDRLSDFKSLIDLKTSYQRLDRWRFKLETPVVKPTDAAGRPPPMRPGKRPRYGPGYSDDNTLKAYPGLAEAYPRGLCQVWLEPSEPGVRPYQICRVSGLPKFGSETGFDEDTDIACDNLVGDKSTATQAVVARKANGKFVVLGAFKLDSQLFLVGGSKTMHRVVRADHISEDLDTTESLQGFKMPLVREIFEAVERQMTPAFMELLLKHSVSGEYEDGKHFVPGDHQIVFFTIINRETGQELNMLEGYRILQEAGVATIDYSLTNLGDLDLDQLRCGHGQEGYVISYLDSDQKVVARIKFKTWWYVMLRILRTLILNDRSFFTNYKAKLKRRLLERNQWMRLPSGYLLIYHQLLTEFCQWFLHKGYDRAVVDISPGMESLGMATVYQQFIEETATNDLFDQPSRELAKRGLTEAQFEPDLVMDSQRQVVLVQLPMGGGKNTIAQKVAELLPRTAVLDQDSFVARYGKRAGKHCLVEFNRLLGDPKYQNIILARCNLNLSQYRSYAQAALDSGWHVKLLCARELYSTDYTARTGLFNSCACSVLKRTGHPSFDRLSPSKRVQLVMSAISLIMPEPLPAGIEVVMVDYVDPSQLHLISAQMETSFLDYLGSGVGYDIVERPIDHLTLDPKVEVRWSVERLAQKWIEAMGRTPLEPTSEPTSEPAPEPTPVPGPGAAQGGGKRSREPLFVSVDFQHHEEVRTQLRELVHRLHPSLDPKATKEWLQHVTLAHRNSAKTSHAKTLLDQAAAMEGKEVTVRVSHLGWAPNQAVLKVGLTLTSTGESLDHMVVSGCPHITGYLPKAMRPFKSVELLQKRRLTLLECDLSFKNTIKVHY